jgi:adenylate kinase family enzyme
MEKIIVIGCPGSGKSTFARALHGITGIPLFHLDMLYWNADKTTVEKDIFHERLASVLQKNQWIIDGNYSSTMALRLEVCDTVIFLDYPLELCLAGIRERQGKPRSDIPWLDTEEDEEFIDFIRNYNTQSRPQVIELLSQYPNKRIHIFTNRREADLFLTQLKPSS